MFPATLSEVQEYFGKNNRDTQAKCQLCKKIGAHKNYIMESTHMVIDSLISVSYRSRYWRHRPSLGVKPTVVSIWSLAVAGTTGGKCEIVWIYHVFYVLYAIMQISNSVFLIAKTC